MLPNSALLTIALSQSLGIPVANLGMSGYGPEQELIVLKRYALKLQPKTIVWMFFEGNDLVQLDPEEEESDQALPGVSSPHDDYWMRSLTRNLLVLSKKVARGCVPHQTFLQFRGSFQEASGKRTELYFWEKAVPLKPTDLLRLDRFRSIVAEANELCRERGIHLVVAFAPVKYRVHRGLGNFQPSTPELSGWPLNDLPGEVELRFRGISADLEFVDLTHPLKAAAAAGILTYLPDDTHWTAEGQRVAGQALHRQVLASVRRSAEGMNVSGSGSSSGRGGEDLQRL